MSLQFSSPTPTPVPPSPELLPSVVMSCVQEGLVVADVHKKELNAHGLELSPKWGCGSLRVLWVEEVNCQVTMGEGSEFVMEPGELAVLAGQEHVRLRSVNPTLTGTLVYGEWEIPLWLEQMLLDPQQCIRFNQVEGLSKSFWEDARLMARTQNRHALNHPILQQAMRGVVRCALTLLEQDPQKSRLARLLTHTRMGPWFRAELQKHGPMASITQAAAGCHYSASGFSKSVLQTTAIPYADFMNHWRMTWSLLRFVHQKHSVKVESDVWGYETEPSFRKRFRGVIGITPGQARQWTSLVHLDETEKSFRATRVHAWAGIRGCASPAYAGGGQEAPAQAAHVAQAALLFDPLTGLARPLHWMNEARKLLEAAHRYGDKMAVAFIDLDHFKAVNEHLGREQSDVLLKSVAQRLQACLRSHDLMARQGGDEFVVLLGRLRSRQDAAAVAQKMVQVLSAPFVLGEQPITVSASVGLSWFEGGPEDMETLLRHADVAMHRAKAAGRNDWCLFRADMDQPSTEQLLLEGGVRQAMEKNEWLLHYQPQIHAQTGALVAVEVLVRWHHSELGLLTPDRWIPLMEHQGHISELSAWVLRRACAQWVHWAGKGLNARLAVNVSASELTHPHFIPLLQGILQDTGMNPVQLELEITESALMKSLPALLAPCQALADMGVRLTLDDFGTGHAQLAPLIQSMHLPLRCIKIDRSFICDVPGDEADEATIHTMLTSAHALGLDVVAEGVERMQQREFLHAQHCDHIQGWWVARPMDAPLFEAWWQRHMQHNKQPAALHP